MQKRVEFVTLIALALFVGSAFKVTSEKAPIQSTSFQAISVAADTVQLDPATGLVVADGFELVRAHCTACHSSKLITQFGTSREGWLDKIRWMQRTQNLWDLGDSEPPILDYLARHYASDTRNLRRKPLPVIDWHLLEPSKSGRR